MRSPYRQVIAALLIAGLFVLAVPDEVWAASPPDLPNIFYYHNDHLGSSSITTDESGDIVHQYVYAPYGDESYADTTYKNVSNRYTGQVLDEETGLYYYNARYYDPEIGRFTQADTVLPSTSSQGLNRYSYCANNPLIYTDPSGHFLIELATAMIIGAIVGAGVGAASSAIMGGDIGKGAMYGAIGGAIGGAFSYCGAYFGNTLAGTMKAAAQNGLTSTLGGKIGAVAGATSAGALSSTITGGDPGLSAITSGISAGVGCGLGLGNASYGTADWYGELAASTCLGAGIGGTVAEIKGGDFWQGAGQAAATSAAGFVISTTLPGVINSSVIAAGEIMKGILTRDFNLALGGCLRMVGLPPDLFDFESYVKPRNSDFFLPKSVTSIYDESLDAALPSGYNDDINGMHSWHAGMNAGCIREFGPLSLFWLVPSGIGHETIDLGAVSAEIHAQGLINTPIDSLGDLCANTVGSITGLISPASSAIPMAKNMGILIPGPPDNWRNKAPQRKP